jgi:predicted lipid-binding transport protein (Tim44 family)
MIASRGFRLSALFAVLLALFSFAAIGTAEARFGGSFGSRGMRTYQTVPSTSTIPGMTAPVQRSSTIAGANAGYNNIGRGGFFGGGLGGWLLGGLMFSGLFGMMFGGGFGGIGGVFSLLIQVLVLFWVLRFVFRRFGNGRAASAGAGNGYNYSAGPAYQPSPGYGAASASSARTGGRDEIGIGRGDLDVFEQRLGQLQDAYSREDLTALRRIATPEVVDYLNEELTQSASQGLRNEVFDVKLLSGDIAEAWREGDREYATVALRYESRDVMRERSTGRLVSGEDRITTKSEVWTFVRQRGAEWILSAIQGA